MPKIDLYLNSMEKFGASGVLLKSDSNVALKFPTGDRFASQKTEHDELVKLLTEVASPSEQASLRNSQSVQFVYKLNGRAFSVTVTPAPGSWQASIEPKVAAARAVAPPMPGGSGPLESPRSDATMLAQPAAPAPKTPASAPAPAPAPAPKTPASAPAPAPKAPAPARAPAPAPAPAPALAPKAPAAIQVPGAAGAINKLLRLMCERGASDLHLSTGAKPFIRASGSMTPIDGFPVYTAESMQKQLDEIMPKKNQLEFKERNDSDFAYAIEGLSRFRVNIFRDRHGPGSVIRAIPFEILSPEQLGLPKKILELCYLTKGLVLVTGPTGSGKSTTLATLIDHVNKHRADHIITIEDPIEFVHHNQKCLVNQREVHQHTSSFKDALRAALREDPDIVLVGEMRDLETIAIAVETAETGHLVFGTLHTTTAPGTIDRIIDQFPADRQNQIRTMLSESLRGVIAQTLCKRIGGGRVAAYEILLANSAVANLIREKKTFQLFSLMQTSRNQGMVTLNDSLLELVKTGRIDATEAYLKAVNKNEFQNLLTREGIDFNVSAKH